MDVSGLYIGVEYLVAVEDASNRQNLLITQPHIPELIRSLIVTVYALLMRPHVNTSRRKETGYVTNVTCAILKEAV